jgi:hypothetical protein
MGSSTRAGVRRKESARAELSRSPIWEQQRRYFARAGVDAWRRNIVPSYVTTNPVIAETYAALLISWTSDLRASSRLEAGCPLTVLEIGGGSGRFAHFLLNALERRGHGGSVRYLLTDVARANVDFWRSHERFLPYFERGELDVALFDPSRDAAVTLEISGATLSADGSSEPLAVVANYVFDGVEQDVFLVSGGRLQEGLVTLEPTGSGDEESGASLDGVGFRYEFAHCDEAYYGDPVLDAILQDYARRLPDGAVSMPVGALSMLARLEGLAHGPLLVLAADKALVEWSDLGGRPPPQPVRHGSVSFTVNFHALAEWTRRRGGFALTPGRALSSLAVLGLCFGSAPAEHRAIAEAYETHVRRFGPDDFFVLRRRVLQTVSCATAGELLSLLRFSHDDPTTVARCYERLMELSPSLSPVERDTLSGHLLAAWERYFPLGEPVDFAFCVGNLLAALGQFDQASPFFRRSLETYGADPATLNNIGLCRHRAAGLRTAAEAAGSSR